MRRCSRRWSQAKRSARNGATARAVGPGALGAPPRAVNGVATGRDAPAELVEVADTVTEMRKLRHAYDRGVTARRGIDY